MGKMNNFFVQRPELIPKKQQTNRTSQNINSKTDFKEILDKKINETSQIKMSKHAEDRIKARNINLTEEQMQRVNVAVDKANEKGVKESLVVVDDTALVVSIKNKTVITAVDSNELKENVFTNIDGAIIT